MRSVYQFGFRCSDGSTKFLMVETVNVEQRQCMQAALKVGLDERVMLLAEFLNVFCFETYNSAFSTVEFAEFMADLAGFDSFPEDLQERIEKACGAEEVPVAQETLKSLPAPVAGQSERLVTALNGMGFGKASVNRWVKSLGPKADSAPLEVLVKDGIRALVSAPAS